MDRGIKIELETKGSRLSIQQALEYFWFDLSKGIGSQCRGIAGGWLKRTYISEIYTDEHEILENGFIVFFNDPGSMCGASSGVTFHMAKLLLAHNKEKFAKMFKRIEYSLVTDFETIEKVQTETDTVYFEHAGVLHGIHLPVANFDKINDHLISNSGLEVTFEELPTSKKKLIKEMVENKTCQCFVCKKIAKGTLKYMTFY